VNNTDVDVLIVGAGHAGLGVAARLKDRGRSPLILDANARVGDSWRMRWSTLRLFTPRFYNSLPGSPFPEGTDPFPGKDEVADFEQGYAEARRIPMRLNTFVRGIRPSSEMFEATIAGATIRARNVVIATGAHHTPRIPAIAAGLDERVRQLHSSGYGAIGALPDGPVLVVGARNSGAEIAMEVARTHPTTIALGTQPPYAPARWRSTRWWRVAQFRSWALRGGLPPSWLPWPVTVHSFLEVDLARAEREGTLRLRPRAIAADGDVVRFVDGSELRPRTVIWATGFRIDDRWIDVPQGERGIAVARHRRGPVPGLWSVRSNLLGSLHWGALAVSADIARSRSWFLR
jgi:putative flavoprotein involved in K+ transport